MHARHSSQHIRWKPFADLSADGWMNQKREREGGEEDTDTNIRVEKIGVGSIDTYKWYLGKYGTGPAFLISPHRNDRR